MLLAKIAALESRPRRLRCAACVWAVAVRCHLWNGTEPCSLLRSVLTAIPTRDQSFLQPADPRSALLSEHGGNQLISMATEVRSVRGEGASRRRRGRRSAGPELVLLPPGKMPFARWHAQAQPGTLGLMLANDPGTQRATRVKLHWAHYWP
eukprot:COSAG02_NODE_2807_length_7985_cov_659.432412_10_plen_151_part_00